jgi:ribonucleotide reductase alpha subunit
MLEQQESSSQRKDTDPQGMTQLEGIRQKVFMDRYSLKDANGQPLEFYPEQTLARVARGIAAVETTEEQRAEWEKRFFDALSDFQFVPGGRILAGAGTGHQVTYYNCMPPDQEVLTADGYRPISEIKMGDLVVTHRNRLRPVVHKFERETEEALYIIRPKKIGYDDLRVTGDHKVYIIRSEWVNTHKSRDGLRLQHEPDWIPAKDIKPGDYVATPDVDLKDYIEYDSLRWIQIDEIAVEDYSGTVLDIEVEEDHSFVSAGVVVSNCFVIPSPEDSRQGILDNLKIMTEIMARGGGVGINLSTLRPRGSYIKTVNGTASGPCSWAQLYSVATGDVIQQGGSRRGALMLMLDDTHPDIEEFITVKRTPGKIEHANLSVCVSDAFIQAVKDDADWNLTWQGEVKKTVRARHLWDLICTSAWESAEPGVVFMDRVNKESNTWYYENIRCVNPCVTGDTLIYTDQGLIPAAELAESGLPVTVVSQDIAIKELVLAGNVTGASQTAVTSSSTKLRQASHIFPTGVKPVFRLQTKEGYTVRLTTDHKVLTGEGWKAAGELVAGEKIVLLNGEGGFGNTGSADLGMVLGWLVGDGYINLRRQGTVVLCFFGKERSLAPQFAEAVNRLVAAPEVNQRQRQYPVGVIDIHGRDESRIESVRLLRLIDTELLINKLRVPSSVLRGSREMQKAFLSALFTANGTIEGGQHKSGVNVRLASSSTKLLEEIQKLLLNFGITSRIMRERRASGGRLLPDGKGGKQLYRCQTDHELIISRASVGVFAKEIGFLTPEKQDKLDSRLTLDKGGLRPDSFLATFESLVPDGEEMVYDLSEPEMHLFSGNGLILHNCGEQPLAPWGVCNLGALNLSAFVKNGKMDYERLAEVSKVAMRFLDNVIDANEYFIEENREAQMGTRRTGLGTMGLADALIKMQIAYGSEESVPVIERIYSTIRDAAYEASADIAAEKGPFPNFERDKYMQGKFIKRLPKHVQEKIKKHGTRNAVLLTQAPTGTTSLLAGVSSGIEPVYDFAMIRRDRTGEHILYHPLLQEWRDRHPNEPTPHYFVSSKDLTPEEHVRVQAMVQRYTDSSISKCVVGDTLVSSERGLLPIADLYVGEQPDTFRSLALQVASLKGTQLTSHFYFGGIKPTQRVKLADGHEITGTPNHQLYVGTPEGLMWKRLDELAPGDYVALKIGAQLFGTDVPLCGFQQSTIRSGYQKTISVPASMNPMLAHFIGSYMAEGCITHYSVRITNNEESVLERLKEESRVLFGLDGDITPQGKHSALTLQIHSKSLCELLRFLGCEGNAAQKTIPWSILQSSRESIVAFLSGLYLDGFITDTKVGIHLASQKLIQQLQIVFDNFGVQTWITARHNAQYNRDYYELNAHGQEAQRILHLLTFDEAHKRERTLKLLRREFQNNKSDLIPIEARKSVFADASRTVRYRHHNYSQALTQDCEGGMLSWFDLRRLANDPEVQLTPSLRETWQESLHFRRVIAVENSGEQPVYDLSVPSTSAFVGNGIVNHNTVNAPNNHTVEQVQRLYRLAYEMGCKGVTYYRDGSRDAVLTRVEDEKKAAQQEQAVQTPVMEAVTSIQQGVKPRPEVVQGYTRNVKAPEGTVNITINSDEHGPLEVFVNVGKAGSDVAALAEALGRLISFNLRILSPLSQTDRLQEIAEQLRGIGGSRSIGFGPQQVRSLPDAVARALELHLESLQEKKEQAPEQEQPNNNNANGSDDSSGFSLLNLSQLNVTGNLCPQCGCNTMVYEEGCRKCYSCGHSEC